MCKSVKDSRSILFTIVAIIAIIFTDSAMLALFHPLEEYAGPSNLTLGHLLFGVLSICMSTLSSE